MNRLFMALKNAKHRACLATAALRVRIASQQQCELRWGAGRNGRVESTQQSALGICGRYIPRPLLDDMHTAALNELLARAGRHVQRRCNRSVRLLEEFVQDIGRTFLRAQALQQLREGNRERGRQVTIDFFISVGIRHVGERRTDVVDARAAYSSQDVDAAARAEGLEPAHGRGDAGAIRIAPPQKAILHRVLGLGSRAQQSAGDAHQCGARRFEESEILGVHESNPEVHGQDRALGLQEARRGAH